VIFPFFISKSAVKDPEVTVCNLSPGRHLSGSRLWGLDSQPMAHD